jgi:hypothetical protein
VGFIVDRMVQKKVEENHNLQQEYAGLHSDERYSEYQTKMKENSNQANSLQTARNGCYILAGLGAVGFGISFVF